MTYFVALYMTYEVPYYIGRQKLTFGGHLLYPALTKDTLSGIIGLLYYLYRLIFDTATSLTPLGNSDFILFRLSCIFIFNLK